MMRHLATALAVAAIILTPITLFWIETAQSFSGTILP